MRSILLIFALSFFISCGYRVDPSKYVPQNASFVHIFDINNLQNQDKKSFPIYSKIWGQNIPAILQIYITEKYKESGVSFNYRAYCFGTHQKNKNENYTTWVFHIDNEKKFDNFVRNIPENNYGIQSRNGVHYTYLNENVLVLWANKIAWIIKGETPKTATELKNQVLKWKEMHASKSLKHKNIAFQNLIQQKLHVGIWLNWEEQNNNLVTYLKQTTGMSFDKKDAYITLDWQLDSLQKLETNIKIYPEVRSLASFDDLFNNNLQKNLVKQIPQDSLLGVWNWNFNQKGWENIQKTWQSNQWWEKTLSIQGFNYQKWFSIITGEGIYFERQSKQTIPQTAWGLVIKNKALLDIVIKQLEKENQIEKVKNKKNIYFWKKTKYYLVINEKSIWATISPQLITILQKNQSFSTNKNIEIPQNVSNWGFINPESSLYIPNIEKSNQKNPIYWYIMPIKQEIFDFKQVTKIDKKEYFWENVMSFLN